jgi:hypothetical protein
MALLTWIRSAASSTSAWPVRAPFDRESELSILFAHLNDPPPRITDLRPELPPAFDAMFETALTKAPDERYQTCRELVRAAHAALEGKVLARRWRVRRRLVVAIAAAVVPAGAALGAILATRGEHAAAAQAIPLRPSALNLIDARTRRVVGHIGLGVKVPIADTGLDVAFTKRAAWVLLNAKQRLLRIDLATRKVAGHVSFPWSPGVEWWRTQPHPITSSSSIRIRTF